MKKFRLPILMLLTLALIGQAPIFGQQNADSDKAVVIQKVTAEDGSTVIKKKRLEKGQSLQNYIDALGFEDAEGQDVEITIIEDGNKEQILKSTTDETVFLFRDGDSEHKIVMEGYENMEEMEAQMMKMQEMLDEKVHQHNHQNKAPQGHSYNYNYNYNYNDDHKDNPNIRSNRPLLGIYPEYTRKGVMIDGLVANGGAVTAGLREDDVITALNGFEVKDDTDLMTELSKYEANETVTVAYTRNGQDYTTQATLGQRKGNSKRWRDPCKIFIGVSLNGTRILGIIPNTSATDMDLQAGDRIIGMDGNPIDRLTDITLERDSHDPGDFFVLTILRDGETRYVDGQFKECEQEEPMVIEEPLVEEIIETSPEINNESNTLQVEELKLFPNPTYSYLTIRFSGEAIPTSFRLTDITGKTIFSDNLPNFSGDYQKQIDVRSAIPGNLILTVQQGDKVMSKQAVLMARA